MFVLFIVKFMLCLGVFGLESCCLYVMGDSICNVFVVIIIGILVFRVGNYDMKYFVEFV